MRVHADKAAIVTGVSLRGLCRTTLTFCRVRRDYRRVSADPREVTCRGCRERVAAHYARLAAATARLASPTTPASLAARASRALPELTASRDAWAGGEGPAA